MMTEEDRHSLLFTSTGPDSATSVYGSPVPSSEDNLTPYADTPTNHIDDDHPLRQFVDATTEAKVAARAHAMHSRIESHNLYHGTPQSSAPPEYSGSRWVDRSSEVACVCPLLAVALLMLTIYMLPLLCFRNRNWKPSTAIYSRTGAKACEPDTGEIRPSP